MFVVEVVVKQPFFSIKLPYAYQVAYTARLPQPLTLLGVLAATLCSYKVYKPEKIGDEYYEECYQYPLRRGLKGVSAAPASKALVVNSILLKRWRLENIKDKEMSAEKLVRKASDAMVREYMYLPLLTVFYIFDDYEIAKDTAKTIWSLERIGDTESLATCISVTIHEDVKLVKGALIDNVKSYFLFEDVESISGSYQIVKMQSIRDGIGIRRDKKDARKLREYVLPLRMMYDDKTGLSYYEATSLSVKLREKVQAVVFRSSSLGEVSVPLSL